jgi:hypothetical protein
VTHTHHPPQEFQPTSLLPKLPTSLPKLSATQIVKILDHFVTVRSTVKNVSASIQRIENFIDSTYQLMDIANYFIGNTKEKGVTIPPPPKNKEEVVQKSKLPFKDEEIPVIDLPKDQESAPSIGQMLSKIDPKLLLSLLGSPAIKRLLTQFRGNDEHPAIASLDDEENYPCYYEEY